MLHKVLIRQNIQKLICNVSSSSSRHFTRDPRPTKVFPVLTASVDTLSSEYSENLALSHSVITNYKQFLDVARAGGGSKAMKRHIVHNKKLLVWERMKLLFDNYESVLEVAPLAGTNMAYGNLPRAGILAGDYFL